MLLAGGFEILNIRTFKAAMSPPPRHHFVVAFWIMPASIVVHKRTHSLEYIYLALIFVAT
jgi:hypothetical protein